MVKLNALIKWLNLLLTLFSYYKSQDLSKSFDSDAESKKQNGGSDLGLRLHQLVCEKNDEQVLSVQQTSVQFFVFEDPLPKPLQSTAAMGLLP